MYVGLGSCSVQVSTRARAHAALRQSVCAGSDTLGTLCLLGSRWGVIRDSAHAFIPWMEVVDPHCHLGMMGQVAAARRPQYAAAAVCMTSA